MDQTDLEERQPLVANANRGVELTNSTCPNANQLDAPYQHDSHARCSHNSVSSSMTSQMSASITYYQHLNENAQEKRQQHLKSLKTSIGIYSIALSGLVLLTMLSYGLLTPNDKKTMLVVDDGCGVRLPLWYFCSAILTAVKLTIDGIRYYTFKQNNQENICVHVGGNFMLMPLIFLTWFAYTQKISNTYVASPITQPASIGPNQSIYKNICMAPSADWVSQWLYYGMTIVSYLSFFGCFYYLMAIVILVQSHCLIKALITKRLTLMRRRDQAANNQQNRNNLGQNSQDDADHSIEEEADEEDDFWQEGMFGSIMNTPMAIPEIISQLDKTSYKSKQAQLSKKSDANNQTSGAWKSCPICWCDFRKRDMVTTLTCNEKHVFHTSCIEEWIRKGNNSCPLCRLPIANI